MLLNNRHILRSTGRRCLVNTISFNGRRNKTIGSYRFSSTPSKGSGLTSASAVQTMQEQQEIFLKSYKIRSSLERLIYHYAQIPLTTISLDGLCEQSKDLSSSSILQYARDTVESLLTYNARRIREFRNLPYLVVLNPSISESYSIYLETMHSLITASLNLPTTLEENEKFCNDVLSVFIDAHADTLPSISKGFDEVSRFLGWNR